MYRASWILYIVGSLLVFGSWVGLVPAALGWCGWLAALGGWAMGNFSRQRRSTCAAIPSSTARVITLEKLALLHKEGVLNDDEFESEKQRILRDL